MQTFLPALQTLLAPHIRQATAPAPANAQAITLAGCRVVASHLQCSMATAMVACLEANIWPLRFIRNAGVLTAGEQATLLQSHVTVLGCGGLGGYVLLLLARFGIGRLRFCDPDIFEETNLNRQALCREDRLGLPKAEAARQELAQVASHITTQPFHCAATPENLPDLLNGTQVLIDCLDSLPARHHAAAAAVAAGIPFVHGSLAGWEGFALLCPAGENTFTRLYPQPAPPAPAIAEQHSQPLRAEQILGTPAATPAVVATLQALLCLRALLPANTTLPAPATLLHPDLTVPEIEALFL